MVIIVTGFGCFRDYLVNPSWEAVKGLKELWDNKDHELVCEEIPVEYDFVLNQVPDKWKSEDPEFVIHVGVSCLADKMTLEKQANNFGYNKPDVKKMFPPENCCVGDCDSERRSSCLDVDDLSNKVNEDCHRLNNGVEACVSEDAGKYLCDFVYFKSLHSLNGRSLFVHVPEIDKPYSVKQMSEGLKLIVENVIKQLIKN